MDSRTLADVLMADLDDLVERTRAAYLERVPKMNQVAPAVLDDVLEATRRTMRQFARYFLEGTLDGEAWRAVRDATIQRAGETFSHEEIVEIIDIARSIGVERAEQLAAEHPELSPAERAKLTKAMDRYATELAEQEDRLRRLSSPSRLDDVLSDLEAEGADLQ
ncbi:MAG TPA: hypothetical protein VFQ85_17545 [Mycobacteriales bacterium]|jgi:hypothetical protein|nr:hypothetical protein [Mycobacteriales bacterium]